MEQMKVYAIMKLQNKLSTLASELEITPKRKNISKQETQPLVRKNSATSTSQTTQNLPQIFLNTPYATITKLNSN